ncbi:MAG TPA: LysR family transcriptional regulator [Sphingomonas sp.]|nr:LysR family transcriptional regulator [Sphingomonas sp.]
MRNMRVWKYIDEVARAGSVRQAAERVNITPSALLRRLQDVEHDLGCAIFERHSSGMKLTAAGELLMRWIRNQNADLARIRSQIGELSGLQLGEVSVACSQAAQYFLAHQISLFRKNYPKLRFVVSVCDHRTALQELRDFECDLVLMFRPFETSELRTLHAVEQPMMAVMASDHPLASKTKVQLSDCGLYDLAMSDPSLGGREPLEHLLIARTGRANVVVELNSFAMIPSIVIGTQVIAFQLEIGTSEWQNDPRLAVRPISDAEAVHSQVILGQLKGRALPTGSAKFIEHMRGALGTRAMDAAA